MVLDGFAPGSIARSVDAICAGALVGMPTETVYGLAADACNPTAVQRIFAAKGRPSDHPLIVHVAGAVTASGASGMANPWAVAQFAAEVPPFAERLMQAFWPGPLTLILPRRADVGRAAAGGQDSIGLRCPSHPVAQALLAGCAARGVHGLAAPSANQFGRVSPTTAAHVQGEFPDMDLLVLDGGPCDVGIESTIVDCTRGAAVLLRPGAITSAEIERVAGIAPARGGAGDPTAPRTSGTLEAHYAPRAKVRLMDLQPLQTALDVLGADAVHIAVYARGVVRSRSSGVTVRRMPDDAAEAARQLFAVLRAFDDAGHRLIWIETPPAAPDWDGVRDRLQRAAAA